MEYLDELRKSTLVDSWSNLYGNSFRSDVHGGLIVFISIGVELRAESESDSGVRVVPCCRSFRCDKLI